ncbi:iron complex transport system permease protein [Lipingzhangella halophila]|uniref:Iron complex transport system permease protein n=1 Tax=Lipingzhangella halophila TaxID=1783352 RepID=A0A7W7W0H3_9ACTN|nr:iron ABC transporter permease [Lipingzhangella halophila]MBB4929641.1 iron complex transport system permease protein [Lipingzhangella halophila]
MTEAGPSSLRRPEGLASEAGARRRAVGLLVLLALLLVAVSTSISVGARAIPPLEVWRVLFSPDGGEASAIVGELRGPRTLLGALVGLALGVAGVLMQSHTRNPIADPSLLGVSHGAACAVVVSVFALGVTSLSGYVWFAIAGALLSSLVVFAVASGGARGPTPLTLILAGAAMTALMGGITSAIVLLDQRSLEVFRFWRIGSLAGRPDDVLWQVLPFLVAGLVLAVANTPGMNILALGDDVATALGQRVRLVRATGVLAIALLTGASVAAVGPIGFVGLMTPHLARSVVGPDHRWLVPYAALLGAAIVLFADVVGRVVAGTGEVEVGVVLAMVGAPVFVVLIRSRRLVAL